MSNEAYTSNSKDGIILKAVIDYAYYESLLEAERYMKEHLEDNTSGEKNPIEAATLNEQVGEGRAKCPCLSPEALRNLFRDELEEFFSKHKSLSKPETEAVQLGSGYVDNDLTPPVPGQETSVTIQPQIAFVEENDHDEPLVKDKHEFLKLIPNKWQKQGKKLLDFLEKNNMYISWNEDNLVSVNNEQIPESNIYDIFRELYSEHPDTNVNGYLPVASMLMDLGMGYLFRKKHFHFLNRKRKLNNVQIGEGKDWFYIGDL